MAVETEIKLRISEGGAASVRRLLDQHGFAEASPRVLEVDQIDRSQTTPLEEGHSLNHFADTHVNRGENGFTLLSVERLILSEERQRIQELSVVARRRLDEIEASRR